MIGLFRAARQRYSFSGDNTDAPFVVTDRKLNFSVRECEQRMIFANANVGSWMKGRPTLPDQNITRQNDLPAKTLYTKTF